MFYVKATLLYYLLTFTVHVYGRCIHINNRYDVEGYYWRDYTGDIPKDAVSGGRDSSGRTTYIGQTLHPTGGILPGKIHQDDRKVYYEFGASEYSPSEDLKILCSQHPEKFRWVTVKNKDPIAKVGDTKLVLGGHDKAGTLLIGRLALTDGQLAVGKVLVINEEFSAIFYGNEGKGFSNQGPYEVLVYDLTLSEYENESDCSECDKKIVNINVY